MQTTDITKKEIVSSCEAEDSILCVRGGSLKRIEVEKLRSVLKNIDENAGDGSSEEKTWKLIRDITLEEDTRSIVVKLDDNGNAFSYDEIFIQTDATNIADTTDALNIVIKPNGNNAAINSTNLAIKLTCGKTGTDGRAWTYIKSINPMIVFYGSWVTTNTVAEKPVTVTNVDVGREGNPYAIGEKITSITIDAGHSLMGIASGSKIEIYGRLMNSQIMEAEHVQENQHSSTSLPRLFFGSALPQTKTATVMPFRYVSDTEDISGYVSTKAQGNSSMSYPKKNQTIRLYTDEACTEKLKLSFKSWGKQSKYCCKANWIDITHARNVVSAQLWGDVVKSRTDYTALPELLRTSPNQGAVDGFPVRVFAEGVYQGRYTMNIPKGAWMANMDDTLDTHCILCGENYVSGCFRASADINGTDWSDELHDTVPEAIKTRWNQVIDFVMNSSDEEFATGLSDYFYVDSLIDYHLFGLLSCGLDAYGKNQLYMTYDGQKWLATMYDLDSTWGLWWNGRSFVASDYDRSEYQDFKDGSGNLLYIRLEQVFYQQLQDRWAQLRAGALSLDNIINRFEAFCEITPKDLVEEDYAATTAGGAFTGIPSTSTNTIQQLRAYAVARRAWCDTYVAGLTPAEEIPCTGVALSATSLTFTEAGSQTLTATVTPENTTDTLTWSTSASDVAAVSNGIVTAVGNGEAVITATCGAQSATCTVSVSGIAVTPAGTLPSDAIYTLEESTTFNGTSDYVNTELKLFETDSDFTIALQFAGGDSITASSAVFHCVKELNPYPGVSLDALTTANAYRFVDGKNLSIAVDDTSPHRIIAVKNAASATIDMYWDTLSNKLTNNNTSIVSVTHTLPLMLGAKMMTNGKISNFWNGTISECAVYDRQLTESEIKGYFGDS